MLRPKIKQSFDEAKNSTFEHYSEVLEKLADNFNGQNSEFKETEHEGVFFRLGDTVRYKRDGDLGKIKSLYTGGQDDIIAYVEPLTLPPPDPSDEHADCLACNSWADNIGAFELVVEKLGFDPW